MEYYEMGDDSFTYDVTELISRGQDDDAVYISEKGKRKLERGTYQNYFSVERIRLALSDIREHIIKTQICKPLICPVKNEEGYNVPVIYSKQEFNQIMDSVQARGVIYTLQQLSDEEKRNGVIAISSGHFAHTLSYFGKKFKIPVTVVMPSSTAHETVKKCRDLSATVIVEGDTMIDAHQIVLHIARTKDLVYIDANHHPNMIIGQATLGIEIFEQMTEQDFDVLILPTWIDCCGITMGIAIAVRELNPNIKIIEIQTDFRHSLINIKRLPIEPYEIFFRPRLSIAYSCLDWVQKKLFDLTVFISNADVEKELNQFKLFLYDYHQAIVEVAFRSSRRLKEFISGKRVLILLFGKTDFIVSSASNEPSLETRAGPSTSSS